MPLAIGRVWTCVWFRDSQMWTSNGSFQGLIKTQNAGPNPKSLWFSRPCARELAFLPCLQVIVIHRFWGHTLTVTFVDQRYTNVLEKQQNKPFWPLVYESRPGPLCYSFCFSGENSKMMVKGWAPKYRKDSQISRRKKCKPSKKDDLWLLIEKTKWETAGLEMRKDLHHFLRRSL